MTYDADAEVMITPGLNLYLLFVVSWFLHLPARVPALGAMRIDLVLVLVLAFLALTKGPAVEGPRSRTDTLLRVLIIYSILAIPFVEWPGTVIKVGLPDLIKAVVFYYFTIAFVRTERDLRRFILVFVTCQVFRVLEPLYLHITEGYLGSAASMSGGSEFLGRLSGSPSDTINPNGLAFLVCSMLSFLYFLQGLSWRYRLAFLLVTPAMLYALALTGSRSGLIALFVVFLAIMVKSKKRVLVLMSGLVIAAVGFFSMSADMQDRYLSTFGAGEKNLETAYERIEANDAQFDVFLRRPIVGHGLGTSPEANYHYATGGPYEGRALPAHDLYLEVGQELGLVGLTIFLMFMVSVVKDFLRVRKENRGHPDDAFVHAVIDALQVWIVMNVIYSFASYGLANYDWYLFAGLSVVIHRLSPRSRVTAWATSEGAKSALAQHSRWHPR
jgi:putative inorganic carbon (HCO3(-)) transporter